MPYAKWQPCEDTLCPKCLSPGVNMRIWESSDEAHEDAQFQCVDCNHIWWVEGTDS